MADYVLVHGGDVSTDTWNMLTKGEKVQTANGRMGGSTWDSVASILRAHGHRVWAPTLENEHVAGLTDHIKQICTLIIESDLVGIVLVGHSYGGMVITGVADKIPDRVSALVYLDAAIPDSGQSLFDFLASSGSDPLTGIPGLEAAKAYVEKLWFDPKKNSNIKKFFIECIGKSDLNKFIAPSIKKISVDRNKWTIWELPTIHVCQPTHSKELAQLLLQVSV